MADDLTDDVVDVVCPRLRWRRDVRTVSALIADVPGVRMVEVDLRTGHIRIGGSMTVAELQRTAGAAGYPLLTWTPEIPSDREPAAPTGDGGDDDAGRPPP